MYEIGAYLVYGTRGVCKVLSIGPMELAGMDNGMDYYTLEPVYAKGNTIFCPVEGGKIPLRPVLTRNDVEKLMSEIREIETFGEVRDKDREGLYKASLTSCDPVELVKIIKTIHERKKKRQEEGKKATALDDKYFKLAEDNLYGELAVTLDITKNEVRDYIFEYMEN